MSKNEIIMAVAKEWKRKKYLSSSGPFDEEKWLEAQTPTFEEIGFIADIASLFEKYGSRIGPIV